MEGGLPSGTIDGGGNIEAEPLFADPGYRHDNGTPNDPEDDYWIEGDYQILAGSPVIDAGDNTGVPKNVTTDLDGNPRFVDDPDTTDTGHGDAPIVDMGPYEFQAACGADLDGDGDADADDFFDYLDAFAGGQLGICDIDTDGDCDADDFFGYLDLFAQGC